MKGRSRPRSRDRSPVPPTPKWKSFRSSDGSDKSKDGKGLNGKVSNGKGGCKDKNENTGKGRKGKTKTKTTADGLKLLLCESGWKPAPECKNKRHEISCQGFHPTCKMLYYGANSKWQWEGEGSDSDSPDDESTKCPSGFDPTLTCPSTPDSEPE